MKYTAVIERPDGSTFYQDYGDFVDLVELIEILGDDYWVVDIF